LCSYTVRCVLRACALPAQNEKLGLVKFVDQGIFKKHTKLESTFFSLSNSSMAPLYDSCKAIVTGSTGTGKSAILMLGLCGKQMLRISRATIEEGVAGGQVCAIHCAIGSLAACA
jgi:hypothetical protein